MTFCLCRFKATRLAWYFFYSVLISYSITKFAWKWKALFILRRAATYHNIQNQKSHDSCCTNGLICLSPLFVISSILQIFVYIIVWWKMFLGDTFALFLGAPTFSSLFIVVHCACIMPSAGSLMVSSKCFHWGRRIDRMDGWSVGSRRRTRLESFFG